MSQLDYDPLAVACVCGESETLELNVSCEANVMSEADYVCVRCTRHRAYYAFGHWQSGTGEELPPSQMGMFMRRHRELQEWEQKQCAAENCLP